MRLTGLLILSAGLLISSSPSLRGQDTNSAVSAVRPPGALASSSAQDTSKVPPGFVNVDKPPQIVKQVVPIYPEKAMLGKLEGRVFVKLLVTDSGTVKDAIVVKSTDPVFDRSSVDAAMKYVFTPAIFRDKPVSVWVVIPFTFRLKPDTKGEIVDAASKEPDYYEKEFQKANKLWMSYLEMVKKYDAAMYFERMREYDKAVKSYREFVKDSKDFPMRPAEMVRHAKLMIEKYSKLPVKPK